MFHDYIHALLPLLHLSHTYRGRKHCGKGESSAYLSHLPILIKILEAGPRSGESVIGWIFRMILHLILLGFILLYFDDDETIPKPTVNTYNLLPVPFPFLAVYFFPPTDPLRLFPYP